MAFKFGLSFFVVLIAAQVMSSSGSACYYTVPAPCPCPPPCPPPCHGSGYGHGGSGYGHGGSGYGHSPTLTIPSQCPGSHIPSPHIQYPGIAIAPPSVPTYPQLPPLHAPNPLTIPLPLPSIIPVGKLCVCKAVQIQPSLVPVPKPCCKPVPHCPCPPTTITIPGLCA